MQTLIKNANEMEKMLKDNRLSELYNKQKDWLASFNSPNYENSMLNPEEGFTRWKDLGTIYSTFQTEISGIYEDVCLARIESKLKKEELANKVEKLFESKGSLKEAEKLWKDYLLDIAEEEALESVESMVRVGADNYYEKVLLESNGKSFDWLALYGLPISEVESEMARFWYSLPEEKLIRMGNTIADAFLHGFISQSRNRAGRTRIRFHYQIGQEALAKQVVIALKEKGLQAVVMKPRTLYSVSQYSADHQFDKWFLLDEELYDSFWQAHEKAMNMYEEDLRDTCGMIGIDQFGAEPFIIVPSERANVLSEEAKTLFGKLAKKKAEAESQWIKPSEISFCKVAFPNMLIGEDFEKIFEDFFELNSVASEPYELLQQKLIDELDTCEYVEIKGYDGNQTDLRVQFWPIEDGEKETKFLNAGGDLNIPYGEVFTTPKLSGTNGIFHVKEIFLQGIFYHDLKIEFENGMIVGYDCAEGKDYLRKNLLYPHDKLTMGEFAIGTNTRAYSIAEKYNIGSRLPILIYEKMGPHIAIGDPCFARSEDSPIYNMYDKKEVVCRSNEVTMERKTNPDVYFGKHVDITLPYGDLKYLKGFRKDKSEVVFLKDGRFVLEGVEKLNEGLK